MTDAAIYCVDTSTFIDLRHYPRHIFESVWQRLEGMASRGRLISTDEVLLELARRDDDLHRWGQDHRALFRPPTREVILQAQQVLNDFPEWGDLVTRETPWADPLVVAEAIVEQRRQDEGLFGSSCMLLTEEKKPPALRIPMVCERYGIVAVTFHEMLEREGWTF
jgi:hypothetical protein